MFRILFLAILLPVCLLQSFSRASQQDKLKIAVSIYPLKAIVEQVGEKRVEVDFIVPPGASPHTFEPRPSDIKKLNDADALFLIGGGLEFWSEKIIRTLKKKPLVVVLFDGLSLLKETHSHGHNKEESFDPHIWLDPVMVIAMVDRIRDTLLRLDPVNRLYYLQEAERFKKELNELHLKITNSVSAFKHKEFVTFHSAWNYFARRYGLKVTGIIEESPGKEASPAHIARLVNALRKTGGKVVFVEPQFNPKAADVIARETGARLFVLDPIGGPHLKGRDSYIGLMNYNLSILEKALSD